MSSGNGGTKIATGYIESSPGSIIIELDFTPRFVHYVNMTRGTEGIWFEPMPPGTARLMRSTGAKYQVLDDGLGNWLGITPLNPADLDEPGAKRGFFMSGQFFLNQIGDQIFWVAME